MGFDHNKYQSYPPIAKRDRRWPDRVIDAAPRWCAVDLRDGNQALVKPMSTSQKQQLFDLLVRLGFKEIEVGFPAASEPDFNFVRKLIDEDRIPDDVTIQVLTQAREDLIATTFESLKGVRRAIVHMYNSTSTVQREQVFALDRQGVKAIAIQGAETVKAHAARYPETHWVFQYSPESFTGTEMDYAVEVVDAVNAVWRPRSGQPVIINLPATVEMATPNVFADQVEWFCDHVQHRDHISLSVHTHNDRGCGVAAAELAVMAGADRVEGTLMGNGERTGNTCLVTMAMNLYSQGVDPALDFSDMDEITRTVEACTEIATNPRHPYAGELVFTAFSGSHQDAINKCTSRYQDGQVWEVAYLPIDPRDLGRSYEAVVRINSQSGKGGVAHVLERDYGITLPRWLQIEFSRLVQREAERCGGELDSAEIHALFRRVYLSVPEGWGLRAYELSRTDEQVRVQISINGGRRPVVSLSGAGNGGVEALADALARHYNVGLGVEAYEEFAVAEGTNASAMACVSLRVDGETRTGVAMAEDTTSAAFQALLSALGRELQSREVAKAV
jgi:2-isopropylmalate synthase